MNDQQNFFKLLKYSNQFKGIQRKQQIFGQGRSWSVWYPIKISGSCDSFNLDSDITMTDKQELKDCAQILLVELQKE